MLGGYFAQFCRLRCWLHEAGQQQRDRGLPARGKVGEEGSGCVTAWACFPSLSSPSRHAPPACLLHA